jgi:diguanylate cyclase (GGDEF)-like protein
MVVVATALDDCGMVRNPKDDEQWALSGRESPFQKKLASLRGDPYAPTPPKGLPTYQGPVRDANSLLRDTQQTFTQATRPEDLEAQALLDSQTGLLNSRQFHKKLEYELRRGMRYKRPVAICMICVDGTKDVKKMYGAHAGDQLVKLAAEVIASSIRDVDFAARYNAEVLAIILPETNANGVKIPAERIRQKIRNQVTQLGNESVYITASLGCAAFPAHAREPNELITKALLALETGAQRGGDAVILL